MMKLFFCITMGLVMTSANGATDLFTDRASWENAIGTPDITEDFEGFLADTEFISAPLSTAFGTIEKTGVINFRNLVDVPPFLYSDNNGSSHASCFVNAPDNGAGSETEVRIEFDSPVKSWGADFYVATDNEILLIVNLGDSQMSMVIPDSDDAFVGFDVISGPLITGVIFRSQTTLVGSGGEGFGMDNIAVIFGAPIAPIMVPTINSYGISVLIMLLGLIGLGSFLHQKKHFCN